MNSPLTKILGLESAAVVTFPKESVSVDVSDVFVYTDGMDLSPGDTWKQYAPVAAPKLVFLVSSSSLSLPQQVLRYCSLEE